MPRTENAGGIRITPILSDNDAPIHDLKSIKRLHFLDPIDKLFLLYKNKLSEFDIIKQKFIEIFPLVTDVDFTIGNSFNKMSYPILRIHEVNVEKWIVQTDMSSGMYRTLSQLVTMVLAEDGDVILIDEAYSLTAKHGGEMDSFGQEALAQLMLELEEHCMDITRYVNLSKDEEKIDLAEVHKRLEKIERDITEARNEHNKYLKELGLKEIL